jgi:alkylation response protein AidB-like acyl-CoA dehydrogenase
MNFDFDDSEKALCDKIRTLFQESSINDGEPFQDLESLQYRNGLLQNMRSLSDTGYFDLGVENGRNSISLAKARETLASVSPSLYLSAEMSVRIFGTLISLYGSSEQKKAILPALKGGSLIGAVGFTETGMSMENMAMETTGTLKEGSIILSGCKPYVVNGPIADWFAVAGQYEAEKSGLGFFIVNKANTGLLIGPGLPTTGFEGTAMSSITLNDCPIQHKNVIGPFFEKEIFTKLRAWEDQILTIASLGLMHRSYESALKYARGHKSGGKPIIAYQEIAFKLSEMLTLLQTSQLLAYRAAWMDQTGDREAHMLARCAKVFCSESAQEVTNQAMQILGIHGYCSHNQVEEGYRDARYLQVAGTSSEISRMKIADGLMKG